VVSLAPTRWRTYASLSPSLKFLIVWSFIVALGSFMVTPFMGVILVEGVGLGVPSAGVLVAVATFIQFGGSIVGGLVTDRLGLKQTMVLSLGLRTSGLALLALAITFPSVAVPAVVLVAAGPAAYLPANKAYIVTYVAEDLRPLFLSISNAALTAGMALGPLLAALMIDEDPVVLLLSAALLFAIITAAHQVTLPSVPRRSTAPAGALRIADRVTLLGALRPVLFNAVTFYLYFFFQSFIGLYTAKVSNIHVLGWVMLINCVMIFFLQPPLSGWIARADYRRLLVGSFVLMAAGMLVMSRGQTSALLLGTALFTLGEVFMFLRGDLEVVGRIPHRPVYAFGVQRLAAGMGGLFAGIVGGFVFAHYDRLDNLDMFWDVVAAQCALAAVLGLVFGGASAVARRKSPPEPELTVS
jgi:MFS family permease